MKYSNVSLDDKYDLSCPRAYMSGTQALVRMTMMQQERDKANGLNTAAYISGYRGSPLGAVDLQFERAESFLVPRNIIFQPGLNEDLAATAIWGTQQAELRGDGVYDGVFSLWYGKGPGVDRSGDAFRHGNLAGTSPNGGVLVLMGDDHTCESSTTAHQSEFALVDAMIPVLNPAGVQELIDYGILGWAMSRYSGCWVGLKAVKDTIEVTGTVDSSLDRIKIQSPLDFDLPEGGLSIRKSDPPLAQEARLHDYKRHAVLAFARANGLDKQIFAGGKKPKIGIVSTGKSYLDVRQALDLLEIDEVAAADFGVRLFKIAMTWPLEPEGVKKFAKGLDLIIVVEEKRSLIETQLREQLYGMKNAPVIIGKRDEEEAVLFPAKAALDANEIALAIGSRILKNHKSNALETAVSNLQETQRQSRNAASLSKRTPYFCAGCPHNSSTVIPDGSRAYAGIGCHWLVQFADRNTEGYTHMGAEGANWIGEAPFSSRDHVFQNLGDGTYNHSGLLAIRAAIASGVTMTYKILYNDAVALTGGQANEGDLSAHDIARQVAACGVERLTLVTNEPDKYADAGPLPVGTEMVGRDELARVQREYTSIPGISVIIYDQTCAAEKRRRRKRGTFPDPAKRVFINEAVCEGCGDCSIQSNCVAIAPLETEFGRKREIDQSMCNKDFSCIEGLCPSFVIVEGGTYKGKVQQSASGEKPIPDISTLPEPEFVGDRSLFSAVVTGVGGTGVVTIGSLIGMAAHLEGKGCGVLDMAGLSQKGGAVVSHIRISEEAGDIQSIRVNSGGANLILGCDVMGAGSDTVLALMQKGKTASVINAHETYPADFIHKPNFEMPTDMLKLAIEARTDAKKFDFIDATKLATGLMGDSIATNLFMLGFAMQKGYLPIGIEALEEAIGLNGVAIEMNINAFRWGRIAAHTPEVVFAQVGEKPLVETLKVLPTLRELVDKRTRFLTDYQNSAYGERYRELVDKVRKVESSVAGDTGALSEAVARYYFKLMAYKDEYEVARLYTQTAFLSSIERQFEGDVKISFQLAPPLFAATDPETGRPIKKSYGPWMRKAFGVLAGLRGVRGTMFDPFGYLAERKQERALIEQYEETVLELLANLTVDNYNVAIEIAQLPEEIKGYGEVKARKIATVEEQKGALLSSFHTNRRGRKTAA